MELVLEVAQLHGVAGLEERVLQLLLVRQEVVRLRLELVELVVLVLEQPEDAARALFLDNEMLPHGEVDDRRGDVERVGPLVQQHADLGRAQRAASISPSSSGGVNSTTIVSCAISGLIDSAAGVLGVSFR